MTIRKRACCLLRLVRCLVLIWDAETLIQPRGWALTFHPDFIKGTSLGKKIMEYGFFSYDVTEALHISKRERQIVLECFQQNQRRITSRH